MRELKFRAWDGKKMLSHTDLLDITIRDLGMKYMSNPPRNVLDIMQYTGLKDKNGNEIFEGDIVYIAGTGNCEVIFGVGEFLFKGPEYNRGYADVLMEQDLGEIIGNIYESPELLNK